MSCPPQHETPEGAPPGAANARSTSTTVDHKTHPIGIIILSHAPPKGIGVSVDKEYFKTASNFADLPARLTGRVDAWVRKEHGRLRLTWEADASNTLENLDELLRDEYSPMLELGDNGRYPRAKGSTWRAAYAQAIAQPRYARFRSAADQEQGVGGEQIKVKYKEGARELEQSWTKQVPTFVTEDWAGVDRKLKPRLNVPPGNRNTLEKMLFNVGISLDFASKVAGWMNQRLPGGKGPAVEKTTAGEVVRLWGYMGALAKNPGLPVKRMWQDAPRAGDILPPPNMRSHGMVKSRFNKLVELHATMFNADEGDLDANDPWRYARPPVDAFNDHMRKVFVPGWSLVADDTMSAFTGAEGVKDGVGANPKPIPLMSFVERKPEPLGAEIKNVADGQSEAIIRLELQEGAERHVNQKYYDEYGHTAAVSLRLLEPYFKTTERRNEPKRIYGADSWFMGVNFAEALYMESGKVLFGFGDVKTNTARFPKNELATMVGKESGDWATITTDVACEDGTTLRVFGVGHRRGPEVHTYLSTHGSTLKGEAQRHKDDDLDASTGFVIARKCPRVLNDWTRLQPIIDKHNKRRQYELAMEKRFRTESFPFRLFTTILGIQFCNSIFMHRYFNNEKDLKFHEALNRVFYAMMHNTLDEFEEGNTQAQ